MLTLLYFLFGPLLVLVAVIVTDATGHDRKPRALEEPPGPSWYLGLFGLLVTFVGFMATL